jgi:hypothetical protein
LKAGILDETSDEPFDGRKEGVNIAELISCDYGKLENCFDVSAEQGTSMRIIGFDYQKKIVKAAYPEIPYFFQVISRETYTEIIVPAILQAKKGEQDPCRTVNIEDGGLAEALDEEDDDYPF